MRVGIGAIAVVGLVALSSALAQASFCGQPPREETGGCIEYCELPGKTSAQPSEDLLAKLRSIAPTGHHVDSALSGQLVQRKDTFRVGVIALSEEAEKAWQRKGRWAGPCTGLRAVFYTKLVEDADPKNVVEIYELQYPSEAEAQRVQTLLVSSWDWNYHPYVAVSSGASVVVVEGRHRAWGALARVAAVFGATFRGGRQR